MAGKSFAQWKGFAEVQAKLESIANFDPSPVLPALEQVLYQDNREGVLAGTDGDGKPMPETVRQKTPVGFWAYRRLPNGKTIKYWQAGSVPSPEAPAGVSEGDGPPLAPRGVDSRVITDFETFYGADGPNRWRVVGHWDNVVSKDGVPFLPFHFEGRGRLPTRDLAGLRPDGMARALAVIDAWAAAKLELQSRGVS